MTDLQVGDAEVTRRALQRRTLRVLILAQVLGGAGLAAGVTVGALLAEDLLGSTSSAGLPAALFTAGSAAAALLVGRLSHGSGRRIGLAAGYAAGAVGAGGIVVAAAGTNVTLLLVALVVYGAGTATNLQARYAGADLAEPTHRGRAVSTVLVATTVGAVAGPNLVAVTGRLADGVGIPALAGPFVLACLAYGLASAVLYVFLRPDPLLIARALQLDAPQAADPSPAGQAHNPAPGRALGSVRLAATAMVLTQAVMVAIMTMTPVHLRDHGHGLGAVGAVIATHIAFMYLPSPVTGQLADRFGRPPVMAAGGAVLLAAGVVAATAPQDSVWLLALALALLGLGWNLGLIAGTAMVTDVTPPANRARTQGLVDLPVALAGAAGGLSSGVIVAATSYAALSLGAAVLALLILPLATDHRDRPTRPVT